MSPYDQGFNARLRGETIYQNPFATFTAAHGSWAEGWKDQDHHLNARDDALESIGWFG